MRGPSLRALALVVLVVGVQALVPADARASPPAPDPAAPPLSNPLAACARLYGEVVFDGMVDYDRLAAHPEREACQRALAEAQPPVGNPDRPAVALAFWVNAYNLLTLLAIAAEPERWSAQQDGGALFRDRVFTIAGRKRTLDQIEHEDIAALTRDPRVEFLLSCGSRSCALLPPAVLAARVAADRTSADRASGDERAARIDAAQLEVAQLEVAQLEVAMSSGQRRWFAAPGNLRVNHAGRVVEVGQLLQLDWHGADFERAGVGLTRLIAEMLKSRDPVASEALLAGRYRLAFRPYDWRVNRVRRTYLLP